LPQPDVIRGGVDHLNRPFIKLNAAGFADPLTAFIDTGFNGSMILDEYQAARMGLEITKQHSISAVLASQRHETFLLCRGRISWFGEEPFVSAFVISETEEERLARRRRKQEEEIVLGVELLLGCKLEIDFTARTVIVTRPT
jgi:predicted aspartyl protease